MTVRLLLAALLLVVLAPASTINSGSAMRFEDMGAAFCPEAAAAVSLRAAAGGT